MMMILALYKSDVFIPSSQKVTDFGYGVSCLSTWEFLVPFYVFAD